ncbi:hypothetical protein A2627_01225 [Candidatus Woesebacteria bacterium RIFCSPHIGHO2_01_FULL_39_28]|uniref:Short-chain dehydrogenase n=1 Tax=Candidatus Woesebacteria bacterium RIFCSPHIGHO2_01_FULL_39_28 TaxID=1802496 RepID=A0A1F7YH15_9BACT|nr:MAG: hypothetical protein A2627_01225 [Candidatus Woesebacteria bacterium RIFCSPHIGHO2_01_FULL_39_28]OGM57675.1 MAG: hypothetical protein A3A50_01545 [Candidatus Woesebacteria bacterium RIFCSPLOWO2_01_FULL_38_20]
MEKVVVISGGSDGLGKAIAKRLVKEYRVIILSPTQEKLKLVSAELGCNYRVCDVTSFEQVSSAVESIIKEYGKIDCLINCAGLWIEGELETNDPTRIEQVIKVNTLGTIFLTKATATFMKEKKAGTIINIVSNAGLYAKAFRSIYVASKFALTGFTKSLEEELAPQAIKVVGIYPGPMRTKFFEKIGIQKDMNKALDTDEVAKTIEFLLSLDPKTEIQTVELKNIDYN